MEGLAALQGAETWRGRWKRWLIKGHFWPFVSGFVIATLLWVLCPGYRLVCTYLQLTCFQFMSWLKESKFVLAAILTSLLVIFTWVCVYILCEIQSRRNMKKWRKAIELNVRKDQPSGQRQNFNARVLTTMQKAGGEAAMIIGQAQEQAQEVLNEDRQEPAAIKEQAKVEVANLKSRSQKEAQEVLENAKTEAASIIAQAKARGARTDRSEHKILVQAERLSPYESSETEPSDNDLHENEPNESSRSLDQANILSTLHGLSGRQTKAIEHISEYGTISIQDFERLYPQVSRRTLQRDLKALVDKGLLISEGATHHMIYRGRG